MSQRDELFRLFGPILIEAVTDFLLDNINTLRKEQGMKEITKDEFCTMLLNHVTKLEPYSWMNQGT